jgi:hypothetical protein
MGAMPGPNFAAQNAALIRIASRRDFTIAANAGRKRASVKPVVGIDLSARRCIEGEQLARAARPVTQRPHLEQTQPPKRTGFGVFYRDLRAAVQKGFP